MPRRSTPLLAMEGATTLCANLNRRTKTSPAKSKGFFVLRCCLLCLGRSEDHNLGTSTFPETAGLGTLCGGLSGDASKQADFQETLSTAWLPAPLPGTSNLEFVLFPVSQRKAARRSSTVAASLPASHPPPWASPHPTTAWLQLPPGWLPTQHHGHPPWATIRRGTSGLGIRNLVFSLCLHLPQCILPFRLVM